MKVLIAGGSGFLGKHLSEKLTGAGHSVVALSSKMADLTDPKSLHQFNSIKFDRIFHLAAWTQAGDFAIKHPGEQWNMNQAINTTVLSWWQQHQPQAKMIATGTSCSYATDLPLKEENYLLGEPIESLYTYAHTKRMMLIGLRALRKQFGLNYLYVVPSTLYGSGYHTDGRQLHFIFDLIRKIFAGKHEGQTVTLWGDGYQKRELILVDDFVDIMLALDKKVDNDLVNIGGGHEYTIRDFAGMICKEIGYDANKIVYDTSKYVGAKSKCLDITKLKGLVQPLNFTSLEEGLTKTVKWFAEHRQHFLA